MTNPAPIDFESDAAEAEVGSDALARIAALVSLMRDQQEAVTAAAEALSANKAALLITEREDLPMLMTELGLSEVKLTDGTTVAVDKDIDCNVSEDRMPAAVAWLRAHGHEGIVKTRLLVEFGRDQDAEAQALADEVGARTEQPVELAQTIHPQTLKAFIKERMEAGEQLPTALFGIRPFNRAKLKAARAPKSAKGRKR